MVVLVGVTDTAPDVCPAVVNLVLVQVVAFVEDQTNCDEPLPRMMELGLAVKSAVGDVAIEIELLHARVTVCAPEVTVTEPVFVPEVVYCFTTDCVVPERLSVPAHEYVYEPTPPVGDAVQVMLSPV